MTGPMDNPDISRIAGVSSDTISDTILGILAKETGVERSRLHRDARLSELEIASLDLVQTIFELEARFDIEIPVVTERSGAEFETVGDMLDHVQAAIDARKGGIDARKAD